MNPATVTSMILWGATGQARVLRECMSSQGVSLAALFDNDDQVASPFGDVPIHHGSASFEAWLRDAPAPGAIGFLVAIGGERGRARVALHEMLQGRGLTPLTARHPSAFIASSARIAAGAQVLAHATVCVEASLGRSVIVNTAASVDHECVVGQGVHICPGARLAGNVTVGDFATIGTGAIVLPRIKIGDGAVVGAGTVVIRDVGAGEVVVGNPARVVGKRS